MTEVEPINHYNRVQAVEIVKRTFGDDLDLSEGTFGDAYVKLLTIELDDLDALREKLIALAITLRMPELVATLRAPEGDPT